MNTKFKILPLMVIFIMSVLVGNAQLTPTVSKAKYFRKTIPLRDMKPIPPGTRDRSWKDGIIRNEENFKINRPYNEDALPDGVDPVLQDYQGKVQQARGPIHNFDGIGNVNGVFPPDTEGDVGTDHYFQMINLSFAIWDKEGNQLYEPVDNSTLWAGFIGPWTGTNDGDPIVLYDEVADRWMASQFAINTSNGTYWQLIAVSETGDPLGAYYQYAFQFPAFNDYPKFGVWHDAYYASFNIFGSYFRAAAAAFERDAMLVGDANARMVLFDLPDGSDPASMLPSDFDGTPPPLDAPNYFVYFNDDAWGYSFDQLRIWEFNVDWTNTGNSTFTEAFILQTEPFDWELCSAPRTRCIPQPNTSTKLETLSDRLMYRLQYRKFNDFDVMVTNHTVDVNGNGLGGVRWYEMRDYHDGNGWIIYQQGTYSPDDNHRWMGSIAMNGLGNIALGYSVSSSTVSPSVRYTGHTANAPLGEMNLAEVELVQGFGSQTSFHRWGDYSMMAVDPSDDSTFWYTQEYMNGGWKTRISSFNFDPVSYATVNAGDDDSVCEDTTYQTSGAATNNNSVYWTTSGDGIFGNPATLNALYWRGPEDLENGQVTLTLTAYGFIPGDVVSDSMLLSFSPVPVSNAGNDTTICQDESITLSGYAENQSSVLWTTQGDGVFDYDTSLTATYTPGTDDILNGSVQLTLTAYPVEPCNDEVIDNVLITIDECTGMIDHDVSDLTISLIPNPTTGMLNYIISGVKNENIIITVLNTQGQIILTEKFVNASGKIKDQLDMTKYPKGTYYFKVQNNNSVKVEKIVVQ